MKQVLNIFIISIFFLFIAFSLTKRLHFLNVDNDQIFYFQCYFGVAYLAFACSIIRFKSFINPMALYSVFICLLAWSFILLSEDQQPLSFTTLLIINISIIGFLLGNFLSTSVKPISFLKLTLIQKKNAIILLSMASVFSFGFECISFGYIPILKMFSIDVYTDTLGKFIPFLHYFITCSAFIPIIAYLYFKEKIITKKTFRIISVVSVFIMLNYLSKQFFLILIICCVCGYLLYNKISKIKVAILFSLILFLFIGVINLRANKDATIDAYFRVVANISNNEVTFPEAFLVEYSSKRFTALNTVISYCDSIDYVGGGIYTLRPLLSFFFLEKMHLIERDPNLDTEMLVSTYLGDPYIDFGFVGVFVINFFYGYLATRYYNQYKDNRPEAVIKFSLIIFCILMGMFVNYYNTMFVWIGFIVNKVLVGERYELRRNTN